MTTAANTEIDNRNTTVPDDDNPQHGAGFNGYVATALDPSPWLFWVTTAICVCLTLVVLPVAVLYWHDPPSKRRRRRRANQNNDEEKHPSSKQPRDSKINGNDDNNYMDQGSSKSWLSSLLAYCHQILSWDDETRHILQLGVPYTVANISDHVFSNVALILVSHYSHGGVQDVAAYALVHILLSLTNSLTTGPAAACAVVCSHAIGAGNHRLAGLYVQWALLAQWALSIPICYTWWHHMGHVVLTLGLGDAATAAAAQAYCRAYLGATVCNGTSATLWQLLDITGHAAQGTLLAVAQGILETGLLLWMGGGGGGAWDLWQNDDTDANDPNNLDDNDNDNDNNSDDNNSPAPLTLHTVGLIFTTSSLLFLIITIVWAETQQWFQPFHQGLFAVSKDKDEKTNSNKQNKDNNNTTTGAMTTPIRTALPLSWSDLSGSLEWSVLTAMASHCGTAEVAAFAIMGNIWDLFYYLSSGFGEATEIRTSLHLGENRPHRAALSTYKSLALVLALAVVNSTLLLSLRQTLPRWYTTDATLQGMLQDLIPFAAVANLAMAWGMGCWSTVGAQGKFDLATWVSMISTWLVSIPLAAVLTYVVNLNLQGLMAASTIGYVGTGAYLSFVVFSTDWTYVAKVISEANEKGDDDDDNSRNHGNKDIEDDASCPVRHFDKELGPSGMMTEQSPLLGGPETT